MRIDVPYQTEKHQVVIVFLVSYSLVFLQWVIFFRTPLLLFLFFPPFPFSLFRFLLIAGHFLLCVRINECVCVCVREDWNIIVRAHHRIINREISHKREHAMRIDASCQTQSAELWRASYFFFVLLR